MNPLIRGDAMTSRCRGCGGPISEDSARLDGLCAHGGHMMFKPKCCYLLVLDWAARLGLPRTGAGHSVHPATVDAWLEAGAPGVRRNDVVPP